MIGLNRLERKHAGTARLVLGWVIKIYASRRSKWFRTDLALHCRGAWNWGSTVLLLESCSVNATHSSYTPACKKAKWHSVHCTHAETVPLLITNTQIHTHTHKYMHTRTHSHIHYHTNTSRCHLGLRASSFVLYLSPNTFSHTPTGNPHDEYYANDSEEHSHKIVFRGRRHDWIVDLTEAFWGGDLQTEACYIRVNFTFSWPKMSFHGSSLKSEKLKRGLKSYLWYIHNREKASFKRKVASDFLLPYFWCLLSTSK